MLSDNWGILARKNKVSQVFCCGEGVTVNELRLLD